MASNGPADSGPRWAEVEPLTSGQSLPRVTTWVPAGDADLNGPIEEATAASSGSTVPVQAEQTRAMADARQAPTTRVLRVPTPESCPTRPDLATARSFAQAPNCVSPPPVDLESGAAPTRHPDSAAGAPAFSRGPRPRQGRLRPDPGRCDAESSRCFLGSTWRKSWIILPVCSYGLTATTVPGARSPRTRSQVPGWVRRHSSIALATSGSGGAFAGRGSCPITLSRLDPARRGRGRNSSVVTAVISEVNWTSPAYRQMRPSAACRRDSIARERGQRRAASACSRRSR